MEADLNAADTSLITAPNNEPVESLDFRGAKLVGEDFSGRDLRGTVEEARQVINDRVELPEGYRIEFGGQFESEARASRLLLWTSLAAVCIIFVLLYFEFRDVRLAGSGLAQRQGKTPLGSRELV